MSRPRDRHERFPRASRRRRLADLALLGALTLVLSFVAAAGCCDRLFYYPTAVVYSTPAVAGLRYEAVEFTSRDGTRLTGWFLPAVGPAKGTVVHCHGNAQNMTAHYEFVKFLPGRGFNLFVFDYRGYGRSEGSPSRRGTVEDARAAVDFVMGRRDVDPGRVGLMGQSLGGAIAAVVAGEDTRIKAVVLDSAFSSYQGEAAHALRSNWLTWLLSWPLSHLLIRSGLDPIDSVAEIAPRPVLFIHGTSDQVVPCDMSRAMFKRAAAPKELWLAEGANHTMALYRYPGEYETRVCTFFESAFGR